MRIAYFDIETGPDEKRLEQVKPDFQPKGNVKNPDKVRENVAAQEKAWHERAALSALTGRVLCIGVKAGKNYSEFHNDDNERNLLQDWWTWVDMGTEAYYCGHNIFAFDLPFLVRRSWLHKVQVPRYLWNGRYWSSSFIDTMKEWQFGDRKDFVSLDSLGRWIAVGGKLGSGADFAELWRVDRNAAIRYLRHDLMLTEEVAVRMGIQDRIEQSELEKQAAREEASA